MNRIALLLLSLLLPAASAMAQAVPAAPASLVEGVDYELIEQPGTWGKVGKGEVEIVEVFAYTCHHCADLAPKLEAWKARLPKHVKVRYVPAGYDVTDTFGRGFFASESLGTLRRTHQATFDAVHESRTLPRNPTDAELTAFYATQGVDARKFAAELASPKTTERMKAARDFSLRVKLQGTPTLIVAGKYRVIGTSLDDLLQTAAALALHPPL